MANVLAELIGTEYTSVLANHAKKADTFDAEEDAQEVALQGRTDIGPTEKSQLVKARRGQGLFKVNVRLSEKGCRITGVTDLLHLRASHIKPWKDSTEEEKLNGCNGLLLAPHIDHLFDRGFISFLDDGAVLMSPLLDKEILKRWGISYVSNVGLFKPEQAVFLDFHRVQIFKGTHLKT